MDFIIELPKYLGKDCIYVVVDRLKKNSHLFVVTSSFSVAQVADIFFKEIFRLHQLPKSIVSDRDSRFMGDFWKEILDWWELSSLKVQYIIHKLMEKKRG